MVLNEIGKQNSRTNYSNMFTKFQSIATKVVFFSIKKYTQSGIISIRLEETIKRVIVKVGLNILARKWNIHENVVKSRSLDLFQSINVHT